MLHEEFARWFYFTVQLSIVLELHDTVIDPAFLTVHVSVQIDGILSIYMEYMCEGSIHKLLQKNGPFNEYAIRRCTAQILSGLAYLHERKIAHR